MRPRIPLYVDSVNMALHADRFASPDAVVDFVCSKMDDPAVFDWQYTPNKAGDPVLPFESKYAVSQPARQGEFLTYLRETPRFTASGHEVRAWIEIGSPRVLADFDASLFMDNASEETLIRLVDRGLGHFRPAVYVARWTAEHSDSQAVRHVLSIASQCPDPELRCFLHDDDALDWLSTHRPVVYHYARTGILPEQSEPETTRPLP